MEITCLTVSGFGLALVMIGIFVPRWRVDDYGVRPLAEHLENWPISFASKEYGLLAVRGSRSQSWSLVTRSTCDWTKLSQISTLALSAYTAGWSSSDKGCSSYERCGAGFANHMANRCENYSAMYYVSMATLATSFLGILVSLSGLLVATLGKMKQSAGIAYGLIIFSGLVMLAANIAWALVTHFSFVELGNTAWYPYPDLGIGWFLHLYGCVTMIVSISVFWWLMAPVVMAYYAQEAKLAKRKLKLSKMNKMKKSRMDQEQQQGFSDPHNYGDDPGGIMMNFPQASQFEPQGFPQHVYLQQGMPQPGFPMPPQFSTQCLQQQGFQASQQRMSLQLYHQSDLQQPGLPQGLQQHRRQDDFGLGRMSVPNLPPAHVQPQPDYRAQPGMQAADLYGKPVPASAAAFSSGI